jgi:Zn-dependent peptidase ImmA (M78 family)
MALSWAQVHRLAMLEAARVFSQLGIDRTRRIDPFWALEAHGVLVIRRPLDHLAGIYLPAVASDDGRPGVLVNIRHPVSRQRFTAAHELAHHRRDREAVLDEDTEFIARGETSPLDRERVADAFAAWFLMPKELVAHSLLKLGLDPASLDPPGAYGVALECGTSYEATVRHLADMKVITESRRDVLLRTQPQRVKRALGALDVISDSRRDVWIVKATNDEARAQVQEGDAVIVEVEDLPSSGYLWQPAGVPEGLSLVRDESPGPDRSTLLGGTSLHRFMFRVQSPGHSQVRLVLQRPWQSRAPVDQRFVEVDAEPLPSVGVVNPLMLVQAGA